MDNQKECKHKCRHNINMISNKMAKAEIAENEQVLPLPQCLKRDQGQETTKSQDIM